MPRTSSWWLVPPLLVAALVLGWMTALAVNRERWEKLHWTIESSQWPVYSDLRVIQRGMEDKFVHGLDPVAETMSAANTIYNYPRAWLLLGYLGVHHVPLPVFGAGLGFAWVLCLLLFVSCRSAGLAAIFCTLLVSPPVLLVLERGNNDLFIAILIMVAAALWSSSSPRRAGVGPFVFTLCGVLKLYPAAGFALTLFDLHSTRRRRLWIAAALAFAAYWTFHVSDLATVSGKTPRPLSSSFGSAVLPQRFEHYLEALSGLPLSPGILFAVGTGVYALVIVAAALAGWRLRRPFAELLPARREVALFLASLAVFAGVFALGNNFSYRLIIVLPCLALLWLAFTAPALSLPLRQWSALGIAALLATFLAPINSGGRTFIVSQLAIWLLVGTLLTGFFGLLFAARETENASAPSPRPT
jgi:hypothetical protein